MDHLVKETVEMHLHPNNFSWEDCFTLSRAWQPITKLLKQRKGCPKRSEAKHNYLLTLLTNLIGLCPFTSPSPALLYIQDSLGAELYQDPDDGDRFRL
jgi:hypothetical protein